MDIVKAKIAIVNEWGKILILTRSQYEDTRQGDPDLPGGSLESYDITVADGLCREVDEELPGTTLRNITELDQPHRKINELGQLVITHVFAGWATLPLDGIRTSHEHEDETLWVPRIEVNALKSIPGKYRRPIRDNPLVFEWLIKQAQDKLVAS